LEPRVTFVQLTQVAFRSSPEVMAMLGGGSSVDVYGVPMSKTVAPAASKFMHAQSSICSILTCQNLIGTIFSLVILKEFQQTQQYIPYLNPTNGTATNGTATPFSTMSVVSQYAGSYWISAVFSLVCACCIGSAIVIIARFLLSSRSHGGLKFCCIFEGICAGYVGCQSVCACGYLIIMAMFVASISSGTAYCSTVYYQQSTTPATGALSSDYLYCLDAIAGLHKIGIIFSFNLAFVVCMGCCYASACGTGSKFATETSDLMEDEEAGSMDQYY